MEKDNFNIYLRGFKEEDTIKINAWRHDPKIQAMVSTSFKYVSEAIEREWVKSKMMSNRTDIYLAICLKENDEMVGYVSLNNIDYINRTVSGGGIVIDPKFQDGFIRYETGILMRELVFDHLNLNRLEGKCIVGHKTTQITLEATGYKYEGTLRSSIYKNGKYHDQLVYSLLRADYYEWLKKGWYSLPMFARMTKYLRKNPNQLEEYLTKN